VVVAAAAKERVAMAMATERAVEMARAMVAAAHATEVVVVVAATAKERARAALAMVKVVAAFGTAVVVAHATEVVVATAPSASCGTPSLGRPGTT